MKTVLTKFLALSSIGLLALAACKKNDAIVKTSGGAAGTLSANTTTPTLDKTKLTDTTKVVSFSFSKSTFGFSAAVTNTLQIDPQGDNWASPTSFTLGTNVYSEGFSTNDFNNLMLKLNLPAGVASQVNVRLKSSVGGASVPVYSNVLNLTVTPFNLTSWVYVPGAYEGSTWPNPGPLEDSLVSVTGNGVYIGIIYFTAGNNQFLITPVKNWNNKWATSAPAVNPTGTSVTDPVVYNGPNNFYAPTTPGYYLLTFNSNSGSLTIEPADFYTIIGSAPPGSAWSSDYAMKYINDGSGTWEADNVPMTVGEYKFRQDGQWTNSWGPSATAGMATDSSPIGDGNLQLTTAGNYNLTFVMPATPLGTSTYTNLPTYSNVKFPFVTTSYTSVKQ